MVVNVLRTLFVLTNNVLDTNRVRVKWYVRRVRPADASPDARPASAAPVAEPGRDRRRGDGGARRGRRRLAQHARGGRPPRDRPVLALRPLRRQGRAAGGDDRPDRRRAPDRRGRQRPVAGAAQGRDPRDPLRHGRTPRPRPRRARQHPDRPERPALGQRPARRPARRRPPGPRDRLRRRHPAAVRERHRVRGIPLRAPRTCPTQARSTSPSCVSTSRRCRSTGSRTSSRWRFR